MRFFTNISFRFLYFGFQMVSKWRVQKLYMNSIVFEMLLWQKSHNAFHQRESIALGLLGFLFLSYLPMNALKFS